jgi:hypothetical protein
MRSFIIFTLQQILLRRKNQGELKSGAVARIEAMRNACKILIGNLEGKRPLRRPSHRWEGNITTNIKEIKSRDSSVGIAPGYGLDDRGSMVRFAAGAGNFSLHHRVQNGSGVRPASYPMVPGALSLGVKRPEREAHYSPPSSAEVKEYVELYIHSPIRIHGVVLS